MNEWNLLWTAITLSVILLCFLMVFLQRRKVRKIMKTLNQMLDYAMEGSFTQNTFDETLLSSVESRLNHYLAASAISGQNVKQEKEKIKELLADISHQTKTPISNILLYAQLLEEQGLPEGSREYLNALQGQTEKLNFLIASLIKLSRLETGVFTLQPIFRNVAPMLEEAFLQFQSKAREKEIGLTLDGEDTYAVFDHKWTAEALCNLVDNAIKYTPEGGKVAISVKEYPLFCRIDVADTGMGIPEAEQAKIFGRFYRSPLVSEQEGVGIGLYLARQIAAGQGGYIKVVSSLGEGAVFSMFLPKEA